MATLPDRPLYRLLTWLSPAFPVGGYSYSHGLEYAVEAGLVSDAETLAAWVGAIVRRGGLWVDAVLFRAVWQAVVDGDEDAFAWAAERSEAMRGTAELALESRAQGRAFLAAIVAAWPEHGLDRWARRLDRECRPATYPVAVALACAVTGIPLPSALLAFVQASAGNLVSAGVRLIPLGQTDGQRVIAALEAPVLATVRAATTAEAREVGSAAVAVDWASMHHETQYARLFRS